MTKVHAIVLYHGTNLYNITVTNDEIGLFTLFKNADGEYFHSVHLMYLTVLSRIDQNDFFLNFTEKFKLKFFDIAWIDILNPYVVEEFGF